MKSIIHVFLVYFMACFLVLLFTIFSSEASAAPEKLVIEEAEDSFSLEKYLYLMEDERHRWSIEEVSHPQFPVEFKDTEEEVPSFGFTDSVYWVHFEIENRTEKKDWYLEVSYPLINYLNLHYGESREELNRHYTGNMLPFEEREIKDRNFIFPVEIEPHTSKHFYLRAETKSAMVLPLNLWTPEAHGEKASNENLFYGILYGIFLALFFYNLFLAIFLKNKTYLFCSLYIFGYMLFQSTWDGLSYQHLWPEQPEWNRQSISVFLAFSTLSFFLFTKYFLETRMYVPTWDKILNFLIGYSAVLLPLTIILPYYLVNTLAAANPLFFLLMIIISIICLLRGYRPARYYLTALSLFCISAVLSSLMTVGIVQDNILREYGLQVAFAVAVILLSLALADRITILNLEKEIAQQNNLEMQQHLLETQERWSKELEAKVKERTKELQKTLQNLKDTQNMLIQSEKMSSLGNLVAGIAHETNTPLGIAVTSASHLYEKSKEIRKSYQENKLKKSELENFFKVAEEDIQLIEINLKRASELIHSFKQVAADQSSETKRNINLAKYLNEIAISLKPKLKKTGHNLEIKCPESIEIESYPGALSRIISNLVINSITHAFDENQAGRMEINVEIREETLVIEYSDNGMGMPPEVKNNIFEPFYTTDRRGGSTGLGMHIVYNTVTSTLNGSIKCESEKNKGTRFIIEIPI